MPTICSSSRYSQVTGLITFLGCPSYGEITAKKLLDKYERVKWWDEIVKAYNNKGFDENYVITMARLVRILRAEDWDATSKSYKLWKYNKEN